MAIIPFVARDPQDWTSLLLRDGPNRTPHANVANALIALRSAPEWQCVLGFDEFSGTVTALSNPPWKSRLPVPYGWTDYDDLSTTVWLQQHGIRVGLRAAVRAVETVAREHSFHPIRDYLRSLSWDGTDRIDDWLSRYLGVNPTDDSRLIGQRFLTSAVARVMEPGCQVDDCPVLEASQGMRDTCRTCLRTLFEPWVNVDELYYDNYRAADWLIGAWLVELASLDTMRKPARCRLLRFLSRVWDHRRPVKVPRQCVFVATINQESRRKPQPGDGTGRPQFRLVRVGEVDIDALRGARDQLWAEAYARYRRSHV